MGGITRVQEILDNPDKYYDKVATIAGWARTVRAGV